MIVYQVVFRNQKCRIRRIKVLGEEANCFRVAGPIALWPSKTQRHSSGVGTLDAISR